ncbi:transcription factor LHW [Neltuma alba]|uniref:transcription factor LHW n=1 Tax=Neltuma alba TaxID=207710 RepID=UPI0010A5588D|nr:transcription factor LHW-like [Prosopis alba]
MGFLLKEVLKTLCSRNQWSYAVFWKIGRHNPQLLIWEDFYYEPLPCQLPRRIAGTEISDLPFVSGEGFWRSCDSHSSQLGTQEEDRVCTLINKMMVNNSVNVMGEGIIGRAAFTGNHQWIHLNNFGRDASLLEVYNEVHLQFSAGMQTVAVIPVLPYGVVQLGSFSLIMENMGLVNEVKSFAIQLGRVPCALPSEDFSAIASMERSGNPVRVGVPVSVDPPVITFNSAPSVTYGFNQEISLSSNSRPIGQPAHPRKGEVNSHQGSVLTDQTPDINQILSNYRDNLCEPSAIPMMNPCFDVQPENLVMKAEVMPLNLDSCLQQHSPSLSARSASNKLTDLSQSGLGDCSMKFMEQEKLSGSGSHGYFDPNITVSNTLSQLKNSGGYVLDHSQATVSSSSIHGGRSKLLRPNLIASSVSNPSKAGTVDFCESRKAGPELRNDGLTKRGGYSPPNLTIQSGTSPMPLEGSDQNNISLDLKHAHHKLATTGQRMDDDLLQAIKAPSLHLVERQVSMSDQIPACLLPPSSDDLFDVLGVDLKNKLLNEDRNKLLAKEPNTGAEILQNKAPRLSMQDMNAGVYSINEAISDSGVFSERDNDHLLDAVVSRAKSFGKQDSDDMSCWTTLTRTSNASVPSPAHRKVTSDHPHGGFSGLPKDASKAGAAETSSLRSGCSRDDARKCSQTASVCGSQLSSWVENATNAMCENSVSTGCSKRPDEVCKSNRKRLKPGENPRPRPKDRQMIQDRVKELREIVPNGAKCSIDALLERTIKHMLFLQSVTKHADKLKQTGESKIMTKEGGLLLKDNFEGGATWAYEIGSQSMVCPIIVEDLNPPRQMLVEMLCEERGFFLEIADLIRGLGLTILKGVMETRNDKIWACFAVEANRDVTRMEIFMSLVHLLEQTGKGSAPSSNPIYHSFPQATQISAADGPSNLQ